jgi:hypothetical protein
VYVGSGVTDRWTVFLVFFWSRAMAGYGSGGVPLGGRAEYMELEELRADSQSIKRTRTELYFCRMLDVCGFVQCESPGR